MPQHMIARVLVFVLGGALAGVASAADPLPSWNDGAAKTAIVDFVAKVTKDGGPNFVPPAERIATFDNDGTLWAEQPLYFQFLFAVDRVKALASKHPEWTDKDPFAAVLRNDLKGALAGGERAIVELVTATHAGMTSDEFTGIVKAWLSTATHPTAKRPYTEMETFIVSGGGVEFIRAFAERVYGIPPEQVVGSTGGIEYVMRDGKPALMKLPRIDFVDDGAGKPVAIQRFIGRRPIAAFGNSDGDLQMLEWTCLAGGPRLCLYVHHDDAAREWAYDRQSSVGRLDKGLDEANARGWTVVGMKDDWKRVFP